MIQIWSLKKNVAPLRRNALFFWSPVLLLPLGGRTFKNTWFFDDPAGLSEKMCAPLRQNARKNENQFLNGRVGKVSGAKHQKTIFFQYSNCQRLQNGKFKTIIIEIEIIERITVNNAGKYDADVITGASINIEKGLIIPPVK